MGSITRFISQDEGADLIEYALLAGLISLAAVATLTTVGTSIPWLFTKISTTLTALNPYDGGDASAFHGPRTRVAGAAPRRSAPAGAGSWVRSI